MKKLNLLYITTLVLLFFSCDHDERWGDWSKSSAFPGRERVTSVVFQTENAAYVGMGYNSSINTSPDKYLKDFYKCQVTASGELTWSLLEGQDFPDKGRRGSVAFVIGDTAYVGAG